MSELGNSQSDYAIIYDSSFAKTWRNVEGEKNLGEFEAKFRFCGRRWTVMALKRV